MPIQEGSMEKRVPENRILLLPVNGALAFLVAQHTNMCLDMHIGCIGTYCMYKYTKKFGIFKLE